MSSSHGRVLRTVVVACSLVVVVPEARAQEATTTGTATALFDQAVALMERGNFAEACPKLARSNELSPNGGTLFALAECYERSGKIASAWVTYKEAAIRANAAKRVDAETRANDAAARLAPNISKLVIEVPPPASVDGLSVALDGRPVARAEWGVATPIDPGRHTMRISAPNRVTATREVAFDGTAAQKTVSIPVLAVRPAPVPEPVVAEGEPRGRTQRILGFVVGGVGVAGLAMGAVFGFRASAQNDEASAHCRDVNLCDAEGIRLDEEARDAAMVSTVAFIAGGALAAGGLVLLLTAPNARGPARSATLGVRGAPGGTGGAVTFGTQF